MNFPEVLISELTVEQFVQVIVFINLFIIGVSGSAFFLLYQLFQLLKYVFSSVSSLIKSNFCKSNN